MRVGGNERGGWKGMLDIFTPRRLRGGVKIRVGEFLGGGGVPQIIGDSPPPATASRSHPPPASGGGYEFGGRVFLLAQFWLAAGAFIIR